ncbi:interferon regulatory factor 8-like isoform X2 [Brienomyrus brachyistius]|uniref:interferon regulatory factor 8-like isoform X2 n=1 Tax=Brienomyrus brachyistius TaxID=42636 RepID=UPI0020B3004B|nr:interferon regulatory factor 8-like isoform X2 [Brienomyrus brachyistius]
MQRSLEQVMVTVRPGSRRLRQWLIEQVHSRSYPGLSWEDEAATMFRIPWKHAGKQDYNQDVDASIFKAWAMYKGKFKEGDKAEPATWKTRLRCALNKSPDFEEVSDRTQLDISEPYKVYRIISEEEQRCRNSANLRDGLCAEVTEVTEVTDMQRSPSELQELMEESSEDYVGILTGSPSPAWDSSAILPSEDRSPPHLSLLPPISMPPFDEASSAVTITFFYGGRVAGRTLCSHPEGCRITPTLEKPPLSSGSLQNISFPPVDGIEVERQRRLTQKLFGYLEQGVLLQACKGGIFIKRLCLSRIFWSSAYAQGDPGPGKLKRDTVLKIFDTNQFLQALQAFRDGLYPPPDPTVTLCFGEELHDVSSAKSKLIVIQITPMNCQQLLDAVSSHRSLQGSGNPELPPEIHSEQNAHIFQDLCAYGVPQPCIWEHQPITV